MKYSPTRKAIKAMHHSLKAGKRALKRLSDKAVIRASHMPEGQDENPTWVTIESATGAKTMIKGRNLYANGLWRKPWANEAERKQS